MKKQKEKRRIKDHICTKIHGNPYNNSSYLGYWSKVVVLNEEVQFFKHVDYSGYVFYITVRASLTHDVICKKTQAIDGVVVMVFVFLLIYGERYLHVLGPTDK